MREYTDEEMFVEVRRKEILASPKLGEIFQGIMFSLFHSKGVLEKNKADNYLNYSEFILALEELGKIKPLGKLFIHILFNLDEKKSSYDEFLKLQKSHELKLQSFLDSILSLSISISQKEQSKLGKILTEVIGSMNFNQYLQSEIENGLNSKIHRLRMELLYPEILSGVAVSPHHKKSMLDIEIVEFITNYLLSLLNMFFELFEKVWPKLFNQIKECYFSNNKDHIKNLKIEINRLISRILPSFRKEMIMAVESNLNITIEDYFENEKKILLEDVKEMDINNLCLKARELAESKVHIENRFTYGPLKDSAKFEPPQI